MDLIKTLESLVKTLEAGSYNTAPGQLVQGSALQIEDLSPVMHNVTFDDSHIKLQKLFTVKSAKSLLVQYNRQLSYGRFGGSAQREGAVGDVDVGDYIRATVPMAFYSHIRRVTLAADMVDTLDSKKGSDREAENAAMKLAGDIEFDSFKGKGDFSNAGVFDGNPNAMPALPNMLGLDSQIRQSDILVNTQDLMFAAYGSNQSVVLNKGGSLDQAIIQDSYVRSRMNMGTADRLMIDPIVLANYNKTVALGTGTNSIQRIGLAGSAQDASGADLRRLWVSNGTVSLEDSRFLSGKTSPDPARQGAPAISATVASADVGGGPFQEFDEFVYLVTAENERGEGQAKEKAHVVGANDQGIQLTIDKVSTATHYNVYRGSSAATAKFIGRVKDSGGLTTAFTDLGNKSPGFVTGYLIQSDTWGFHELSPYSRVKLAMRDLSTPEAHFRFLTLAGYQPRKNVIVDDLTGQL